MVNLNLSTTVLLPALLAAGATTTMVFSVNNGMFAKITDIVDDTTIVTMPGTDDVPLTREWTGVAALDRHFTALLVFFWPLLDGRHPAASLHAAHFFGQMGAYWTLMQLEATREGNKRRLIAYTTLVGLLYQNVSVAVAIPLWCLLHLLTLDPSRATSSALAADLSVCAVEARVLPWAMALGYVLPSVAMAAPPSSAPGFHSVLTQQTLASAWQAFPLWIALSGTFILRPLFARRATSAATAPPCSPPPSSRRAAAPVHLFALLLAALPRAAALALSLSSVLFPSLFHPSSVVAAGSLHPAAVFLPKYSPPGTDTPLAEGVLRFLQWDECVSGVAALVWAGTVYLRDARIKGGERWGVWGVVARGVGWSVVAGPAGAAVALVWGRDEVVFAGGEKNIDRTDDEGEKRTADSSIEEYFLLDMMGYIKPDIEVLKD